MIATWWTWTCRLAWSCVPPEGSRNELMTYQAHRLPNQDWGVARMTSRMLEDPPKKPWTSVLNLSRGLGIAWGLFTNSPDVGSVRISLVDGQVAESTVSNGSALMFVPFNSAQLWSSTLKFGFYDTQGREILTESLPLDLRSLTSKP